jgi:hypothetical protein
MCILSMLIYNCIKWIHLQTLDLIVVSVRDVTINLQNNLFGNSYCCLEDIYGIN